MSAGPDSAAHAGDSVPQGRFKNLGFGSSRLATRPSSTKIAGARRSIPERPHDLSRHWKTSAARSAEVGQAPWRWARSRPLRDPWTGYRGLDRIFSVRTGSARSPVRTPAASQKPWYLLPWSSSPVRERRLVCNARRPPTPSMRSCSVAPRATARRNTARAVSSAMTKTPSLT